MKRKNSIHGGGSLVIRERREGGGDGEEESSSCWIPMKRFVGAIMGILVDDLEHHWKEKTNTNNINIPAGGGFEPLPRGDDGEGDSLPEGFRARIREMNGTHLILVLEKNLFQTDVRSVENRLSIPLKQVRKEFLSEGEKRRAAAAEGMEVQLLQPSMEVCGITLKKWQMKKTCFLYVLTKQWNAVVRRNLLKAGDLVQVWSFRVGSELRFALVRRNNNNHHQEE